MSDREKKEQEIMNQEMSSEEMETVAGGGKCDFSMSIAREGRCWSIPAQQYGRPARRPDGSMNCAATVEDGSHCGSDDACYEDEVVYLGIVDCEKAWQ